MIIPKYWAEARLQHRERKRQVTVRRFGWSDVSEADAQVHAEARAREAFDRALSGEPLLRRERRVAYNGADGVPIREEVVDRDGETVITRNSYGALCLNTPNVLFADIDFERRVGVRLMLITMVMLAVIAVSVLVWGMHFRIGGSIVIGAIAGLVFGAPLAHGLRRGLTSLQGGDERVTLRRVRAFVGKHPEWHLRVYRTPAGLRLLAMHRVFDPRDPQVTACFDALGVDRVYARMCRNQNCFRARVSPKPWRMGMPRMRAPYAATWRPEHAELPARREWIANYEQAAMGFASCRFIETIGHARTDAAAAAVQALHDVLCQCERELPIA